MEKKPNSIIVLSRREKHGSHSNLTKQQPMHLGMMKTNKKQDIWEWVHCRVVNSIFNEADLSDCFVVEVLLYSKLEFWQVTKQTWTPRVPCIKWCSCYYFFLCFMWISLCVFICNQITVGYVYWYLTHHIKGNHAFCNRGEQSRETQLTHLVRKVEYLDLICVFTGEHVHEKQCCWIHVITKITLPHCNQKNSNPILTKTETEKFSCFLQFNSRLQVLKRQSALPLCLSVIQTQQITNKWEIQWMKMISYQWTACCNQQYFVDYNFDMHKNIRTFQDYTVQSIKYDGKLSGMIWPRIIYHYIIFSIFPSRIITIILSGWAY